MFERYTDDARRALFFARAAVSEHGGTSIGPVPLLLGVVRSLPPAAAARLGGGAVAQQLSECLVASITSQHMTIESVEIPFDPVAKRILRCAGRRPPVLHAPDSQDIAAEDVLLALLRERPEAVVACLQAVGFDVDGLERVLADQRGW